MKIQETKSVAVSFDKSVYTNTYISNYSGETEFKFTDYREDGSEYKLNVNVPIEIARSILSELQTDLDNYDAFQAKKAQEAAEEVTEE